MSTRSGLGLFALALTGALVACGGDGGGSSSSGSSGSTSSSGGTSSGGTFDTDASTTTAPSPKAIPAPTLDGIMKMMGALHVSWTLPAQTVCDKVTLERKTDTEAYKVVYTLPGSADNKHDASATQNTSYTYRVQCFVGTDASPYSNEMSANPVQ